MRRVLAVGVLVALAGLVLPPGARAGGPEYPAPGARGLGRAGAYHARADDPMALLYNPANLAVLPGVQLSLDTHVGFYDACFDRAGTYGNPSGGAEVGDTSFRGTDVREVELPKVCNSGPPALVPELALTFRPIEQLGIGIGVLAPSGVGQTKWGRAGDGTVARDGMRLPSPARYMLVEEELLIVYPSIGVGYQPHPRVRFGATFGSGIGLFNFTNYVRALAGEDFNTDIRANFSAQDYFIPRVTVSAHTNPIDNLDLMVGFTWTDDVEAKGTLELESTAYRDESIQRRVSECSDVPYDRNEQCVEPLRDVRLEAPQPWQLAFGARYAQPLTSAPGGGWMSKLRGDIQDPMSTERWDVELDVVYERNSLVDSFVFQVPPEQKIVVDAGLEAPLPEAMVLPHRWRDQLSVRLGGDYNLVPGVLALRGGLSYETMGVDSPYQHIAFNPFQRYGVHLGGTVRMGRFDVSLAYAFLLNQSQTVREDQVDRGEITPASKDDPGALSCPRGDDNVCTVEGSRGQPQVVASLSGSEPTIVNAGKFTSLLHVASIQLRYHFQ